MSSAPRKVVFLGRPQFDLAFPVSCAWASVGYVRVRGSWRHAVEEAVGLNPQVSLVFDPRGLESEDLAALGGLRIGVATASMTMDDLAQLKILASNPSTGFRWVSLFEPAAELTNLPVLQLLPQLIDTARLPPQPALDTLSALLAGRELLPAEVLPERIPILPASESPTGLVSALAGSGILLYPGLRQRLGQDSLPLLALAMGLLLVSDEEFPQAWGIEQEDEYLVRPVTEWKKTLHDARRAQHSFRPVRIRAWQKVREMFDASLIFKRLIHDALLFHDPSLLPHWPELAGLPASVVSPVDAVAR